MTYKKPCRSRAFYIDKKYIHLYNKVITLKEHKK